VSNHKDISPGPNSSRASVNVKGTCSDWHADGRPDSRHQADSILRGIFSPRVGSKVDIDDIGSHRFHFARPLDHIGSCIQINHYSDAGLSAGVDCAADAGIGCHAAYRSEMPPFPVCES